MDLSGIFGWLELNAPWSKFVLMGMGTLVVLSTAYIAATPSKDDDAWFEKVKQVPVLGWLITAVEKFSLISRK